MGFHGLPGDFEGDSISDSDLTWSEIYIYIIIYIYIFDSILIPLYYLLHRFFRLTVD